MAPDWRYEGDFLFPIKKTQEGGNPDDNVLFNNSIIHPEKWKDKPFCCWGGKAVTADKKSMQAKAGFGTKETKLPGLGIPAMKLFVSEKL